jgi:hypothetical protein
MEAGDLLRPMFRLDCRFAVPDVLYELELREHHPGLVKLGHAHNRAHRRKRALCREARG